MKILYWLINRRIENMFIVHLTNIATDSVSKQSIPHTKDALYLSLLQLLTTIISQHNKSLLYLHPVEFIHVFIYQLRIYALSVTSNKQVFNQEVIRRALKMTDISECELNRVAITLICVSCSNLNRGNIKSTMDIIILNWILSQTSKRDITQTSDLSKAIVKSVSVCSQHISETAKKLKFNKSDTDTKVLFDNWKVTFQAAVDIIEQNKEQISEMLHKEYSK